MTDTEIKSLTRTVKAKIKRKFRNTSRFAILSGMPYHYIQNAFKKNNGLLLRRIEKAVEETDDKPIFDEVTKDLITKVKAALKGKDVMAWCRENGVPHFWLVSFLKGEVRFKNHHRVARLLLLLDIEE